MDSTAIELSRVATDRAVAKRRGSFGIGNIENSAGVGSRRVVTKGCVANL